MYITDNDYKTVIGPASLNVVSQTDSAVRLSAQTNALEEIAGYLRPRYDVNAEYAKTGDARNGLLVMYACDIALWHMTASQPQKMGGEIRKERYERALQWLKAVQAGQIVPDLGIAVDAQTGEAQGSSFVYGSIADKQNNNW